MSDFGFDPDREEQEKELIDCYLAVEDACRAGWDRAEELRDDMPPPFKKILAGCIAQQAGELLGMLYDFNGEGFVAADRAVSFLANERPYHGSWNAAFPGVRLEADEVNNANWIAGFLFGLVMPGDYDAFWQMSVDHHKRLQQEEDEP